MKKLFITFIVLIIPFSHIVFGQTVIVRPETYREKEERKMNDAVETFKMLGEFGKLEKQARETTLNNAKNSRYSVYVEENLERWKKKGEFEKTADWQNRLKDSTAIKKVDIQESSIGKYAYKLDIIRGGYSTINTSYTLNDWFYNSEGQYDADKEVLIVNTFWGKIPIPIPINEVKNMQNDIKDIRNLKASFFIQDDQLALLSVHYNGYKYENSSSLAEGIHQKERQKEDEERKRIEKIEQSPQYPGGEEEMFRYINSNLRYPPIAVENEIEGRVTVRFVVDKNGDVTNVEILHGLDPSCDREALRVIASMPRWQPARKGGVTVRAQITISVNFRLQK